MGKNERIINQHHGKQPDELSQRYRRLRGEDDPGSNVLYDGDDWLEKYHDDMDAGYSDAYWEVCDPGIDPDLGYIAETIMDCQNLHV